MLGCFFTRTALRGVFVLNSRMERSLVSEDLANLLISNDKAHNRIVALKVIDVDSVDYKVNFRAKDDTIQETLHEINVLKQLKDSKVKNINAFFDAFQVHSQLWIVNDYCPGGSLHTLVSLIVIYLFRAVKIRRNSCLFYLSSVYLGLLLR